MKSSLKVIKIKCPRCGKKMVLQEVERGSDELCHWCMYCGYRQLVNPLGIYKRSKKQIEHTRQMGKAPRTEKQLEAWRKHCRQMAKLPRTEKQMRHICQVNLAKKGKPSPYKGIASGDNIVKHHNDLCHGCSRPNDIILMTRSEHSSLHSKLTSRDFFGKFMKKGE